MPPVRRTRRTAAATGSLDDLNQLVASLIKENQKLKRQLDRIASKSTDAAGTAAARGLRTLARRVERALASGGSTSRGGRRGSASRAATARKPSAPRKPASPETRAKRIAALTRARAARAAKKAAGG